VETFLFGGKYIHVGRLGSVKEPDGGKRIGEVCNLSVRGGGGEDGLKGKAKEKRTLERARMCVERGIRIYATCRLGQSEDKLRFP